jgi:hypothetical protein
LTIKINVDKRDKVKWTITEKERMVGLGEMLRMTLVKSLVQLTKPRGDEIGIGIDYLGYLLLC